MKLVRDNTPDVLAGQPLTLTFTPADESLRRQLLYGKLQEEAFEWLIADTPEQAAKELADLQSVLWELCELDDAGIEQVLGAATLKRAGRGSHSKLTIMRIAADDDQGTQNDAATPIRVQRPDDESGENENESVASAAPVSDDAFSDALGNRRGSSRSDEPPVAEVPIAAPPPDLSRDYVGFGGVGYSG
jgi:predicted house-cleaning noncanonical NTP pyrophosphatase (MazG superfamily)